jgi:uncharacterized phage protein gp47/JayE
MADTENYKYIENGNIIIPDTSEILQDVQNEYLEVFGDSLNLDPSTPQGRLIEIEVNSRVKLLNLCTMIANQINPNYATGQGLDAIGSLFGRNRNSATNTETLCYLTGTPNAVIPANSKAKTRAGDVFYNPNRITFDDLGNATGYFYSVEKGEIPCEINTLTEIVTQVVGWNTINNPVAPILGSKQESDKNFKNRVLQSRYGGIGLLGDVKSRLRNIDNIKSFFVYNNGNDYSVTVDTIQIDRHSILVIVQGGADSDIANALFETVSAGCGYTAISGQSQVVQVPDTINNTTVQYPITFNRPQNVEFKCSVSVRRNNYTGNDLESAVKTAILDWANNQNNEVDGLLLGTDIYSFEIGSAISNQIPEIVVKNVQIAKVNDTLSYTPIEIKVNQLGVITANNITVEITD